MKQIILIAFLLCVISCKNNVDNIVISTGIVGKVKYGVGDCMPIIDGPSRVYNNYNGNLFFIVKTDLDNLGGGDFEQLKASSIKKVIIDGDLEIELPVDTFLVMPEDVYVYSEENTIIIREGIVLEKDFNFWKCTSY